jgi:hypothetical protein
MFEFGGALIVSVWPLAANVTPTSRWDISNACVGAHARIRTTLAIVPSVVAVNVAPYPRVAGVPVRDGRVAGLPSALKRYAGL